MKNKKKRIFCIVLTGVIMTAFISCGNKPNETNNVNITGQTDTGDVQENPMQEEDTVENIVQASTNDASTDVAKTYVPKDYGQIVELREEFTGESVEEITFYYEMENFYVNDTFENADKINNTLQKIYDEYEQSYIKEAEVHKGGYVGGEPISTPHDSWHLLKLTLVGERYISIQYNNIDYMGGAHPYSHFDGITIDCKTGEEVSVSELLGKSDDEILQQVSKEMGMDIVASWDEIDYYLTDATIVFFYRMGPLYWDDVVWERTFDADASKQVKNSTESTPYNITFEAEILEIHDSYFLVEPIEGSLERSSADQIRVSMTSMDSALEPQVGDIIEISYSGAILESYPAQLSDVYNIRVLQ